MRDEAPSFPPLFRGQPSAELAPFEAAVKAARAEADPGLVCHDVQADRMRAALLFGPEMELKKAMAALPVCGIGFQNAFGALAPPSVGVHLDWDGGLRINGAVAGRLTIVASTDDPDTIPAWMVVGLTLDLMPSSDDPGETPDVTSLWDEGCAEIDPMTLLEAWVRHTLIWINRWLEEGVKPIHDEWSGLAHGQGEATKTGGHEGTYTGVDEDFGMLVKAGETTHLVPMTTLLKEA